MSFANFTGLVWWQQASAVCCQTQHIHHQLLKQSRGILFSSQLFQIKVPKHELYPIPHKGRLHKNSIITSHMEQSLSDSGPTWVEVGL